MYEVIARVADNYKISDWEGNVTGYYQGPWQHNLRNFDPTRITTQNIRKEALPQHTDIRYDKWKGDDLKWFTSTEDLPDPKKMIESGEFLVLEADHSWQQGEEIGIESKSKNLWYQIRSYLVKESEFEKLQLWLKEQDFMGRWMPESSENYSIFSKEYYWSPAYKSQFKESEEVSWQKIKKDRNDWKNNEIIAEVLPTVGEHRWEGKESKSFYAPQVELFEGLKLAWADTPGVWFDENQEVACYDPSVMDFGRSKLLVKKQLLDFYLKDKGLKIVWTILGEKQNLGGSRTTHWCDLSGVYYLNNGKVEGGIKSQIKGLREKSKLKPQDHSDSNLQVQFDELISKMGKEYE
jgi:hypothetical protein